MNYRDLGLTDDEYKLILDFMGREPNELELGMFSVMWSEHCGYKNSRPLLKLFPTRGACVIQGPGENAGIIDIGDGDALVFKIESHNHPSAIEPYQGAATGVGGIVRDIFTMGARPIALLNSLRFGKLDDERVKELFAGVVAGIGDYGNCLGIPTVGGEVYFNDCYKENPLVNAMCIGLVKQEEIKKAVAGRAGSPIMLVGAKTGRDGIHGATFASEELSEESAAKRPAVQVGDPFMEKLLIEACLELIKEDLVDGMQDLGAAGLVSSVAETVSKKGKGAVIDVLKVPRREEGMTPYEVMLSESQERMLIIPKSGCEKRIAEIFDRWGLDAAVIGEVTDDGVFRVQEGERKVAEVPVKALTEGCPVYVREGRVPDYYKEAQDFSPEKLPEVDLKEAWIRLLSSPNIASKKWVYAQYDYQVMTNTVILPGHGDAAVLRIKGTRKGLAATVDCNSRMVYLDPYRGGMMAIAEAALNLACVGAKPLAFTNCLNFGNPEKPEIYWQLQEAVKGMSEAAVVLGTPVVSGNVSLYNESTERAVYPTPVVGMVGMLYDIDKRCDMAFKREGDVICLLGRMREELGGSEYLAVCHGIEKGKVPDIDLEELKRLIELILYLTGQKLLASCHDVSEGGLAVALAECAITGDIGFEAEMPELKRGFMFSEAPGRVVVSLREEKLALLEEACAKASIPCQVIGRVKGKEMIFCDRKGNQTALLLKEGKKLWGEAIACLMK
ncbi:phosphoribosylformylglycinamidine synthase subunit II [Thermosyntropha lipolytica DSM 11003]|uniref:Phosphoribosylformylglycinamidine synthase subunit PurL n=1 Tax=Thermosyntropha lipolytica DSM 11003 TaxID=1123382 RepID=A0A1M5JBK7_9FIRM|nr:phosphoribosylformylglycinamidine synthase subunit PurL [Thermosyntropha lipolytica]SHG37393.1 phosphoribosylformylglycinamidine synthase subunit II [Thermosyntropha lipolytica DSM 11003]